MTTEKATLILPREAAVLLSALQQTDGKVDQLLPLLALLQEETGERSELGEALLSALHLIQKELNAFQMLRQDLQARMTSMTETLSRLQSENQPTAEMISEMHGLLMLPLED
jgi:chromosome segregation ATPase